MKKALILNGSHSEIGLIKEAKELGYYVITSGAAPKLIGHRYADEYMYADYSDQETMLKIASEKKIDAVISCANDFGVITAAYLGEKLGLPGHDRYETALLLHHKDSFKEFSLKHGLQVPESVSCVSVEQAIEAGLKYPVIVKPVDLTGGKGVSRADDESALIEAVKNALERSRLKRVVVEQFIEGSYHSFSTFVVDGRVVGHFSDDEYPFIYPYFVASSGGPAKGVEKCRDILIKQAESYARLLKLVNGIFHMQYVMDAEGVPYIMDITRRCSGDLYAEPVEHATGLPWHRWIVQAETGEASSVFKERGEQKGFCGRHCLMAERNGRVKDVVIAPELQGNIYKKVEWWQEGCTINNYLTEKCGVLFWEFESAEEMRSKIARVKELVRVVAEK